MASIEDTMLDPHNLTVPDCVQIAYFLAWPVLGSAIILTSTPSDERLIKVSLPCGWQHFVNCLATECVPAQHGSLLTHCSSMQAMKRQGTVDDEQLAKAHQDVQLQMQRMREAGGQAPRSLAPPRQEPE